MRRFAPQPAPGPYPVGLLARRSALGLVVLAGLFLLIGAQLRNSLTGEAHSPLMLAGGVGLILIAVIAAAWRSLSAIRRRPTSPPARETETA